MQKRSRLLCTLFLGALLTLCVWPGQQAAAQGLTNAVSPFKRAFTKTKLTPSKVERILKNRVPRTRKQLPPIPREQLNLWSAEELPADNPFFWKARRPLTGPYDEVPFWKRLSAEAKQNYFLAANNRALKALIRDREQALATARRWAPALWKKRVQFPHQTWDIDSLSQAMLQRVPPDADYLLLGEEHNQPVIQALLIRFLRQYKAQNPERKIFLLTEFLPAGAAKKLPLQKMQTADPDYAHLLLAAQKLGINVRGLEPRFVFYSESGTVVESTLLEHEEDATLVATFAMPEGVRLRNQAWLQEIQTLRKRYPDALFIIYAGEMHVNYQSSQSVGSRLPKEKTFVISLLTREADEETPFHALDLLDSFRYPFLEQKVLTWDDPVLRRAAGFDMRILIDPKDFPLLSKPKKPSYIKNKRGRH